MDRDGGIPVSVRFGVYFVATAMSLGPVFFSVAAIAGDAPTTFVLAANDTYGVEDCLLTKDDCGQIVADGWCEAHGAGKAVNFGLQKTAARPDQSDPDAQSNLEIDCGK